MNYLRIMLVCCVATGVQGAQQGPEKSCTKTFVDVIRGLCGQKVTYKKLVDQKAIVTTAVAAAPEVLETLTTPAAKTAVAASLGGEATGDSKNEFRSGEVLHDIRYDACIGKLRCIYKGVRIDSKNHPFQRYHQRPDAKFGICSYCDTSDMKKHVGMYASMEKDGIPYMSYYITTIDGRLKKIDLVDCRTCDICRSASQDY